MDSPALLILAGLVVLVLGGELLVRGAAKLAAAANISPLVIGLTVVAFGTSSPELAVSIQSALAGEADIAVGNIVGSNIFNIFCVLGISALLSPLVVSSQLIRLDVPIMVAASFAVLGLGLDGLLGTVDGVLLFGSLVAYTAWSIVQSRRDRQEVQEEFAKEYAIEEEERSSASLFANIGYVIVGLVLLTVGADWLVEGAVAVARILGLSELLIGLTIIAAGTSLPEVAASVIATLRGERDIAVGNIVGSNIFNIFCVLGLTSIVAPGGVPIAADAMAFDIPIMILVAVACLPIFFSGSRISRGEGALFLGYYVVYTTYLVLNALGNPAASTLGTVVLWVALPLTLAIVLFGAFRSLQERQTR